MYLPAYRTVLINLLFLTTAAIVSDIDPSASVPVPGSVSVQLQPPLPRILYPYSSSAINLAACSSYDCSNFTLNTVVSEAPLNGYVKLVWFADDTFVGSCRLIYTDSSNVAIAQLAAVAHPYQGPHSAVIAYLTGSGVLLVPCDNTTCGTAVTIVSFKNPPPAFHIDMNIVFTTLLIIWSDGNTTCQVIACDSADCVSPVVTNITSSPVLSVAIAATNTSATFAISRSSTLDIYLCSPPCPAPSQTATVSPALTEISIGLDPFGNPLVAGIEGGALKIAVFQNGYPTLVSTLYANVTAHGPSLVVPPHASIPQIAFYTTPGVKFWSGSMLAPSDLTMPAPLAGYMYDWRLPNFTSIFPQAVVAVSYYSSTVSGWDLTVVGGNLTGCVPANFSGNADVTVLADDAIASSDLFTLSLSGAPQSTAICVPTLSTTFSASTTAAEATTALATTASATTLRAAAVVTSTTAAQVTLSSSTSRIASTAAATTNGATTTAARAASTTNVASSTSASTAAASSTTDAASTIAASTSFSSTSLVSTSSTSTVAASTSAASTAAARTTTNAVTTSTSSTNAAAAASSVAASTSAASTTSAASAAATTVNAATTTNAATTSTFASTSALAATAAAAATSAVASTTAASNNAATTNAATTDAAASTVAATTGALSTTNAAAAATTTAASTTAASSTFVASTAASTSLASTSAASTSYSTTSLAATAAASTLAATTTALATSSTTRSCIPSPTNDCTCSGPPPAGNANCSSGVWYVPGNLQNSATLQVSNQVSVSGNFTQSGSGNLVLQVGTQYGSVDVTGCVALSGVLTLNITSRPQSGNLVLIQSQAYCLTGNFSNVVLQPNFAGDNCVTVTGQPSSSSSSFAVFLSVGSSGQCGSSSSTKYIIIGACIGGFLLLLGAAIFVLYRLRYKRSFAFVRRLFHHEDEEPTL